MGASVVTCGDAAPVLQAAEHALDDVATLVEVWIEGARVLSGGIVRDDRDRSAFCQILSEAACVIGAVGGERLCGRGLRDDDECGANVSELSLRHLEGDGPALCVADGMDFGRAPAPRTADPLLLRPPFPPAAERWALAVVESIA